MRKLVTILLVGASLLLSSCEYDSVGLSYTSTSYPHYSQPTRAVYYSQPAPAVYYRQPAVYVPSRCYDTYRAPAPDWMRYGGNWSPARRHHPHH